LHLGVDSFPGIAYSYSPSVRVVVHGQFLLDYHPDIDLKYQIVYIQCPLLSGGRLLFFEK
jgi:hypothetical protein